MLNCARLTTAHRKPISSLLSQTKEEEKNHLNSVFCVIAANDFHFDQKIMRFFG